MSHEHESPDDNLIRDLKHNMLERLCRLEESIKERKNIYFRDLAGPLAERMLHSIEEAQSYLHDFRPQVRRAAIVAIVDHWGSFPGFENYLVNTVISDEDCDVQMTALSSLTNLYRDTRDNRVSKILIEILLNEAFPKKLRALAYLGLFRISGNTVNKEIKEATLRGDFRFMEEIDWVFLKSLL